jgi:hypothetical protein
MNLKPLTSWLEDGGPVVTPELAQARGRICAKCPLNVTGDWWEKISKQPVADVIKKWLEIKNEMKIGVPVEKEVGICRACGCVLRIKIWEPLDYITQHTDPETMSKFVPNCWTKIDK